MSDYNVLSVVSTDDLSAVCVHLESDAAVSLAKVYMIIGFQFEYVFTTYSKRPNVFNAVSKPTEAKIPDIKKSIVSLYPNFGDDAWRVFPKFAVLKDPRDVMLMRLSY